MTGDDQLTREVTEQLHRDPKLDSRAIGVAAEDGRVILRGTRKPTRATRGEERGGEPRTEVARTHVVREHVADSSADSIRSRSADESLQVKTMTASPS
jgi:hypothetical protein